MFRGRENSANRKPEVWKWWGVSMGAGSESVWQEQGMVERPPWKLRWEKLAVPGHDQSRGHHVRTVCQSVDCIESL